MMEEAGYGVVIRDVTTRALAVSEAKHPGTELVTVIAPEGCNVKGMNQPAHGRVALRLELRRGSLILAVLGHLRREHYGYTLRKALSEAGVEIDEGALYPMLRRLETQGLLTSEWREEEKRNKRFYRLSPEGGAVLARLTEEWAELNASISDILKGGS